MDIDSVRRAAAAELGLPADDIADVFDSPAGTVVVTRGDGLSYVKLDQPDGAGQTGWVFLAAPHDRYAGPFPVYVSPEPLDADETAATPEADKGSLQDRARELGVDVNPRWRVPRLLDEIAAAEKALAEQTDGGTGNDGTGDDDGDDSTGDATDDGADTGDDGDGDGGVTS